MASMIDRIAVVIDASSQGAITELERLQREAKRSGDSFDTIGRQAGLAGGAIKAGLATGAAALAGGALITFLADSVTKFQESQIAAQQWASMTNTSVEKAGKFTTLVGQYGVELEDLTEINAEFNAKIREQPELLEKYDIAITKNKDGTIDMTATMTEAIDELSKMEDGAARTSAALELFGEEGGKQLLPIINAGRDINDALNKINFIQNSEDAKEFAANTADLALSFEQAQIQLGNFLVPYLNDLMGLAGGVMEFFSTLPGWASDLAVALGLAAGGMVAFNAAIGPITAFGTAAKKALDPVGDIFLEVDGNAKKAQGTLGKFAGLAGRLGLVAGAITVYQGATQSLKDVGDAATNIDRVTLSLKEQAEELNKTDNWWRTLTVGNNVEQSMLTIVDSLEDQARATLDSADASDIAKQRAQEFLDVLMENVEGTNQQKEAQKLANIQTEEGHEAQINYAESLSLTEIAARKATEQQKELNDIVTDILKNGENATATWQDMANAAKDFSQKQLLVKQSAELSEIAMGKFSTSIQGALDWMDRLAGTPATIENLKNQLQEAWGDLETDETTGKQYWKQVTDNILTEGNEAVLAAEDVRSTLAEMARTWASEGLSSVEIQTNLESLRSTLPADMQHLIDDVKAVVADKKNEVPINLTFDVEGIDTQVADLKARITRAVAEHDYGLAGALTAELYLIDPANFPARIKAAIESGEFGVAEKLTGEWNAWALEHGGETIDFVVNADGTAALTTVDSLTKDKSSTITYNADGTVAKETVNDLTQDKSASITYETEFEPGGYNAVKSRLDYLANQEFTPDINFWTHWNPGGYEAIKAQLDYIKSFDGMTPDINVYVHFNPGGYQSVVDRLNNISKNRSATIDVTTKGLAAAEAAAQRMNINSTQRIVLPEINIPTPVNIVKVSVDGKQLRATIRDELLRVRESDDLVAAMGQVV